MKIIVNEIPRDGQVFEETKSAAELDIEREDIVFREPVTIRGQVSCEFDTVRIRLKITSAIKFNCARCLKGAQQRLTRDTEIILPAEQENIIDLTQLAREEVILDYPVRLLCGEQCKGLCPRCGWNLNESACGCPQEDASAGSTHINL